MKVYIVLFTYGDYIGYFDSDILGVFNSYSEAEKCRDENKAQTAQWSEMSSIKIEEAEIKKPI